MEENTSSAPQDTQNAMTPPPAPMQASPKKTGIVILAMLAGLVLGGAIASAVWLMVPGLRSSDTSQTNTTNTAKTSTDTSKDTTKTDTTTAAVANCTFNDLSLSVGTSDGAAGTIYQHLVVTNKSTKSCKLAGYPSVFLLDASNNTLGSGAVPSASVAISSLTLAAGAKAYTAAGFPQAGNFDPGVCTASSVAVRVYIPGTTSYLDTALAKPYCPGFSATAFAAGS